MPARVVLAMSGGVDSSAAACLLSEQGYEVIGLFMRSGATEQTACATAGAAKSGSGLGEATLPVVEPRSHKQGCCSAADAADARRVADRLGIPFHALNFREAFGRIKDYFADEYLAGRTPNPCIMCNNWLKFGRLWDFARQVGAEYIATGHYAQVEQRVGESRAALIRGRDRDKDQSYVLFGVNRDLLGRMLFPVGGYEKPEIRRTASDLGLRVAEKPDSQEICFIPSGDYKAFLDGYRGRQETAGELVDTAGNVVGNHDGYQNFTIGQRRRLGVTFGAPRYVVGIDARTKRVVVGTKDDLARRELEAHRLNWLVDDPPARISCTAQIRYRHTAAPAEAQVIDEDSMRIIFDEPQYGVAPGQAVVLYDGDRVLGGGWIR